MPCWHSGWQRAVGLAPPCWCGAIWLGGRPGSDAAGLAGGGPGHPRVLPPHPPRWWARCRSRSGRGRGGVALLKVVWGRLPVGPRPAPREGRRSPGRTWTGDCPLPTADLLASPVPDEAARRRAMAPWQDSSPSPVADAAAHFSPGLRMMQDEPRTPSSPPGWHSLGRCLRYRWGRRQWPAAFLGDFRWGVRCWRLCLPALVNRLLPRAALAGGGSIPHGWPRLRGIPAGPCNGGPGGVQLVPGISPGIRHSATCPDNDGRPGAELAAVRVAGAPLPPTPGLTWWAERWADTPMAPRISAPTRPGKGRWAGFPRSPCWLRSCWSAALATWAGARLGFGLELATAPDRWLQLVLCRRPETQLGGPGESSLEARSQRQGFR